MYSGNWVRKTNVPYEMKTNKQIKELQYGENHLHLLSFFFSSNNCKRRESLAAGLQKCTTPPYGHTPRTDTVYGCIRAVCAVCYSSLQITVYFGGSMFQYVRRRLMLAVLTSKTWLFSFIIFVSSSCRSLPQLHQKRAKAGLLHLTKDNPCNNLLS